MIGTHILNLEKAF